MQDVKLFRIERWDEIETLLDTPSWLWYMTKSTYDTNNNWIVDNSEKLNNQLPSYYINTDNHTSWDTNKVYTVTEQIKLSWIEPNAEVNNISDVNAIDLTEWTDTTLHYHSADRNRANHTWTQTVSTISDFDTEVSNNTDVSANTSARHTHSNKTTLDWINQSLASWANPTFNTTNFTSTTNKNLITDTQLAKIENWVMLTDTNTDTVTTWGRYWMIWTPTNWPVAWEFYLEVLTDWTRIMQVATMWTTWEVYVRIYNWSSWMSWNIYTPSLWDLSLTSDDITQWTTNYFLTSSEKTVIWNTSWINTWDQDLSWLQAKETTKLEYQRNVICRCRTTANITLSWNQTLDWVTTVNWDYVLVMNQTTASQNWVYIASSSAWTRAPEYDWTIELDKYYVFLLEWTTYKKTWWICATRNATVWTTSLSFAQIPNWIWTASDQASAWNHSHTSITATWTVSMWWAIARRYTSRTVTASTWTTDNVVRFSWSTDWQIETMPDWVALSNNSWRVITYVNNATVDWILRQYTNNTLDWSTSDFTLNVWYYKTVYNIAIDTWITLEYWNQTNTWWGWAISWEIRLWTTGSAPTDWLICDWSAISRTTYSTLFWIIWTTYWVWDWSTTFNIPNLKWKVVVWYDSTQTEFDTLWETGWEKTHTLTTTEMPSHNHTMTSWSNWGWLSLSNSAVTNWTAIPWFTLNTSSNGSGWPHNNLQPYITLNYIIKT